jgi:hypothetical protein
MAKQKLLSAFLGQRQEKQLMKISLRDFTARVLNAMMEHVPLTKVVSRISQQHKHEYFGEFREAFLSALLTSQYVQNIYTTATKLTAHDTFIDIASKVRQMKTPMTVVHSARDRQLNVCSMCGVSIKEVPVTGLASLLFHCGHVYHSTCVKEESVHECQLCAQENSFGGSIQDEKKKARVLTGRARVKHKQQALLQRLQLQESKVKRSKSTFAQPYPAPNESPVFAEEIVRRGEALRVKEVETRMLLAQKLDRKIRRDRKTFIKYMESYEDDLYLPSAFKYAASLLNLVPSSRLDVEPLGDLRNVGVLPPAENTAEVDEFDFFDDYM